MEHKDTAEFVFLYETLLPQFCSRLAMGDVVARLHFPGDGSLRRVRCDLREYPSAIFDTITDMRVDGTVFELPQDPQVLEAVDRYEGYEPIPHATNLFVHKLQPVDLTTGDTIECWPTNTMGNRTVRWSLPGDAMTAQASAHKRGGNPWTGSGQAPERTRGITGR